MNANLITTCLGIINRLLTIHIFALQNYLVKVVLKTKKSC